MSKLDPAEPHFQEFPSGDIEEWKRAVEKELGVESADEFLEWSSIEGVSIPAYLDRTSLEELAHTGPEADSTTLTGLGDGAPNAWEICQIIDHPNPETAREHARTAVENGADALRLVPSLGPASERGVQIRTGDDLASVLNGLDLAETTLHFDGGLGALVLQIMMRDGPIDGAAGPATVMYDPIAELARGRATDPDSAFSLATDLFDSSAGPDRGDIVVDARPYHEAGASAVQELACALGALTGRFDQTVEHGHALASIPDEFTIVTSVSTSYLIEIAKLRALRLLIPQVVNAFRDDISDAPAMSPSNLSVHAENSRRTETRHDPPSNMLRATTEAMAAVIGGCDSLCIHPFNAAVQPPDAFASRMARNTQLILRHEAHLERVADPGAGSYYLETLTDSLARRAWEKFQDLEAHGGLLHGLQENSVQQGIAETRDRRRQAIDTREHVLIGTTKYPSPEKSADPPSPSSDGPVPPNTSGSPLPVQSYDDIRRLLDDTASLAEIVAGLQQTESAIAPFPKYRAAADIEAIRRRTEAYAQTHGSPPTVLLVPMGPPSVRSARATFARNFLGVGGFEIRKPVKFETVEFAAEAAAHDDADVVVICSADETYANLAPALRTALSDRDRVAVLGVAGAPENIEVGENAIDLFVHRECRLTTTLESLQRELEMIDPLQD